MAMVMIIVIMAMVMIIEIMITKIEIEAMLIIIRDKVETKDISLIKFKPLQMN